MLPFPIMNVYGNIVENRVKIVKFKKSYNFGVAIDDQANMWWIGYNGYGISGSGDTVTTYEEWRITNTNVTNVWTSNYGSSIVRTTDNRYYWAGSNGWITGIWPGTTNTSWSEIVFLRNKDVKHIEIGDVFAVAQIGTELYGCGKNAGGVFNATSVVAVNAVTSWVKISASYIVKEFYVSDYNVYLRSTSNNVAGCGPNNNYALYNSSSTTPLTWTSIMNVVDMTVNPLSYSSKSSFYNTVGKYTQIYSRGYNGGYCNGNGNSSTLVNNTAITSSWPNGMLFDTLSYCGAEGTGSQYTLYNSNGKLYGMGTQPNGELGTGDSAVKQTPVQVPLELLSGEKILAIVHGNLSTTIYTQSRVLCSGREQVTGAATTLSTFVQSQWIPNNWYFEFSETVRPWY